LALIIEDDYDLAAIFDAALRAAQFESKVIRAGDIAMKELATSIPDVVILDLHLPHVAGTDILQHIRTDDRLSRVRVIVTTADARLGEMVQEEADLVLLKPISFSQLRDMAKRLRMR
jgi:DNA-binding response OmpR family regulator